MISLAVLWALAVPLGLGSLCLRFLGVRFRDDRTGALGQALAAGAVATALSLFVALVAGVPTGALPFVPLVVAAALLVLRRFAPEAPADDAVTRASGAAWRLYSLWVLVLVLAWVARLVAVGVLPVSNGDEAYLWALKAKDIYLAGGFGEAFDAAQSVPFVRHQDYQLLVPLLQVWMFAVQGEVVHFAGRLPVQALALALLLVAASGLRRSAPPLLAGLCVTVVAGLPRILDLMRTTQADVAVAAGCVLALDGWLRWRRDGRPSGLRLAALGLVVAVWAKNEGLLYLASALAALGIDALVRRPPVGAAVRRAVWVLPALGAAALTWIFNALHGFSNDLMDEKGRGADADPFFVSAIDLFSERIGTVASWFRDRVVLETEVSHGLFVVLALALVLSPRRALGDVLRVPALALLLSFAGFFVVYLGTPQPLEWHLETSARRLGSQLLPAVVLWLGAFLGARRPAAADGAADG